MKNKEQIYIKEALIPFLPIHRCRILQTLFNLSPLVSFYNLLFLLFLVAKSCPTLCNPVDCSSPGSFCPLDFPGKNTGVGCHFLLQGICPTQGSKLHLLHWQVGSLPPGKPSRHVEDLECFNCFSFFPQLPFGYYC